MTLQTTPDYQVWIASVDEAGTDHGVVRVSGDSTVGGGLSGFDIVAELLGHPQLVRPTDIVLDAVHDRYFVVDSDGTTDSILQGTLSDLLLPGTPTLTVLYSQPAFPDGEGITGIALDPDNGIVYFTERNLVQKVDYDTADQAPVTLADLGFDDISGLPNYANEMAFNPLTGQIFVTSTEAFADFIESPPGSGNFISGTLVTRNAIFRIDNIAPSDTDDSGNTITRLEWDTHEQNHPFLGAPDTTFFPDELGLISSLDVDLATGNVYFTTEQINGGVNGEVGGIYGIGPNGGAHTVLYTEGDGTDQNFQYIDVDNGVYFVTSIEPGTGAHSLYTHDLTPGAPIDIADVDVGDLAPQGLAVEYAPTLFATGADAEATETVGAGSGFSVAVAVLADASIDDLDTALLADQLAGARVRIDDFGAAPGSSEQLTIDGTTSGTLASGISYDYDSSTGVMTLTGVGTFDEYEAALALVSYSISGDNPDAYGAAPTRTLALSVFDGLLYSDEIGVTVAIAATNDAPVNTVGGPVMLLETDPSVAIAGLSVIDVDADPAADVIEVTLSVVLGTISVSTSEPDGLGPADVSGNGTSTIVLTGTQDAINATLAAAGGVTYVPNGDGVDTLTMTADDLGNGGAGGAQQDVDFVAITVISVNDPPTAPATNSVGTAEDTPSAPTAIGASDPDMDVLTYSEKPGFEAAHGTVTFDQLAGTFTYTPDADFHGSDSFTIVIDDGNGEAIEQAVSVTVDPVNDAPTAPATNSVNTTEDTASAATAIGAADVDGDTLTYSEKAGFEAGHGTVTFDQLAGTFTYTPDLDFSGTDSFTILVDDGNGGTAEQEVSVTVAGENDAPTGVGGTLTVAEFPANGTVVGTVSGIDPDSSVFTYALVDDAGGRFAIDTNSGIVTVADGLMVDYEQNASHTIRIAVTDDQGASAEFDMVVAVGDVHGEIVAGDSRGNVMVGGAETDMFIGNAGSDTLSGGGGSDLLIGGTGILDFGNDGDTLNGGAGSDILYGGGGNDTLDGGAHLDVLIGGAGNDTFVFRKGEANGDVVLDFSGNGAAAGDSIVLVGYAAGTTFTRVGGILSNVYQINDHGSIELVTIVGLGQVHSSDVSFVPSFP